MTKKVRIIDGMGNAAGSPPTGAKHADFQSYLQSFGLRAGVVKLRADGLDFKVEAQPTPDNTVRIRAGGAAFVQNPSWTTNSQLPKFYEVASDDDSVNEKVTIPANATGTTRTDLIYAEVTSSSPNDYATNVLEFKCLTAYTGTSDPRLAGIRYIPLATLATPNAFATITSGVITDARVFTGLSTERIILPNNKYMQGVKADGTLMDVLKVDANNNIVFAGQGTSETLPNFVVSGLTVPLSGTLSATITAGIAYLGGVRFTTSATAKTFTASKDTYVDVDSAGVFYYTEVAPGAAEPVMAVGRMRIAIVTTGVSAILQVVDHRPSLTGWARTKSYGNVPLSINVASEIDIHTCTLQGVPAGDVSILHRASLTLGNGNSNLRLTDSANVGISGAYGITSGWLAGWHATEADYVGGRTTHKYLSGEIKGFPGGTLVYKVRGNMEAAATAQTYAGVNDPRWHPAAKITVT